MSLQQYNQYPWLTPVRVVATSNQTGTYNNGPSNNGVGATFTYATGALTIDSVVVVAGDRVLLADQTNSNENGIYICTVTGATGVAAVLQRAADQQCIEQLLKGQYVTIAAGSVNAGGAFVMVEPLPANLGVDALSWLSQVAVGAVTFSGPASTANNLAVFSDTAGNLKAASTAATLAFGLTLSTGNFAASQGNVTAGSSGHAGQLASFPGTAANGSFIFKAINNAGGFNSTLSNANIGQATVYTLPDSGQATTNILLSDNAGTQHILSGNLSVDVGNLLAGSSGHAGTLTSFPATAANGSLILAAINNTGGFNSTLSNSNIGQSTVYSLPETGAATSVLVSSQSNIPTNNVAFTIVKTATAAALATAGKVNLVVHPSATSQFAVLDIKVLKSTGLSGGGGDRLLSVSDGTIVFNNAGITAALLGTPILTVWGGSGNPLAVGASEVSTAGADIFLQYIGGATDYTTGSVQVAVTMVQVTA